MKPTFNNPADVNRKASNHKAKAAKAKFIDKVVIPAADLGEPNYQKSLIQENCFIPIHSITGIDFNWDRIPGKWNTIFCLEILEHILNPLLFLKNIHNALSDDGILYLSTPYRPHYLWTEHHYHEIDDRRLAWLLNWENQAFNVEKFQKIRLYRASNGT